MKLIPLTIQTIDSYDIKEVARVLRSNRITQGKKIVEFEMALCKYTGAKYAVLVSSGTAALHLACLVARIKIGDEVVVPPITFVASVNCVLYCGGKPVFVDVKGDYPNIDPQQIKAHIGKKTKAIIAVDFAGNSADMKQIYDIAKKNNLIVIEDAAHALGATYNGRRVGSCKYSDLVTFSFHPTKSITTGEGGAVLTNNKGYYERLIMLRDHGITRVSLKFKTQNSKLIGPWYYEMQELGFNYRITDFQAALGLSQLKKIDRFIFKRRKIAQRYDIAFKEKNWIKPLKLTSDKKSSQHLYIVLIDFKKIGKSRKKIMQYLRKKGIETQVHYIPIYKQPFYREELGYKISCPNTERYYQQALSLPIFPIMTKNEINYVIKNILSLENNI